MNSSFREAMTSIVADAKSLSKNELQAKFDAFEAGPVGMAILEASEFLGSRNHSIKYEISVVKFAGCMHKHSVSHKEAIDTSSNDDCYLMAA